MAYNWQWNYKLKHFRAGCGCQMRLEDQFGKIKQRMLKTCKRHKEKAA